MNWRRHADLNYASLLDGADSNEIWQNSWDYLQRVKLERQTRKQQGLVLSIEESTKAFYDWGRHIEASIPKALLPQYYTDDKSHTILFNLACVSLLQHMLLALTPFTVCS